MSATIKTIEVDADGKRHPLQLVAGQSTLIQLTFYDDDGQAFDLTDCTVKVTFRAAANDGTVQGDPILQPAVTIADMPPPVSRADIPIAAISTSQLRGMLVWDAWVTDTQGNRIQRVRPSLVQVSETCTDPVTGGD